MKMRIGTALALLLFAARPTHAAAVFDQLLGSNQSKTAAASIAISPSSKTVTVGKSIFVAYAGDDVGSAFGVTDNLGNTYTQVKEVINAGHVKTQLWKAPVTTGGSITTITVAWTTNVTAKVAVAGEFSNFGTFSVAGGVTGSSGAGSIVNMLSSVAANVGELWVAAAGWEDNTGNTISATNGPQSGADVIAGQNGTTGGGATSNIGGALVYALSDTTSGSISMTGTLTASADRGGAGAVYNAAGGGGTPGCKNGLLLRGAGCDDASPAVASR